MAELINEEMLHNADKIVHHPNNCEYIDVAYRNIQVDSTDEDGKISWCDIEAFTRHPVVNEDQSDDVVEVITQSGRKVYATLGESFLTRSLNNKVIPINGADLRVGMVLPVVFQSSI